MTLILSLLFLVGLWLVFIGILCYKEHLEYETIRYESISLIIVTTILTLITLILTYLGISNLALIGTTLIWFLATSVLITLFLLLGATYTRECSMAPPIEGWHFLSKLGLMFQLTVIIYLIIIIWFPDFLSIFATQPYCACPR